MSSVWNERCLLHCRLYIILYIGHITMKLILSGVFFCVFFFAIYKVFLLISLPYFHYEDAWPWPHRHWRSCWQYADLPTIPIYYGQSLIWKGLFFFINSKKKKNIFFISAHALLEFYVNFWMRAVYFDSQHFNCSLLTVNYHGCWLCWLVTRPCTCPRKTHFGKCPYFHFKRVGRSAHWWPERHFIDDLDLVDKKYDDMFLCDMPGYYYCLIICACL